ncbi:hypothetical protein CPC08DRAFT_650802 [Agrocybe pediades]|nr:hypothetical protein CPC08DRAFT_650802 [Agrocybe pediades]
MSRPSKRVRTDNGGAYFDPVPLHDDYSLIHIREGRLHRFQSRTREYRTAEVERSAHHPSGNWESTVDWQPPDDHNYALDEDGDWYDEAVEGPVMEDVTTARVIQVEEEKKKKKKKTLVAVREFHPHLFESPGLPEYRCDDCLVPDLVCSSCCVRRHRSNPFHLVKRWTGTTFEKVTLQSLGLKIQLNHAGSHCDNPIPCHANMLVLHTNIIHRLNIFYCGCMRSIPQHIQLLRRRLYPASQLTVKCCASFELLTHLHKLALTTKASTYDFYRALEKRTNNTGMAVPKSRYRALFRMVLQWRHLKMLKWGGRAHDSAGVEGTKEGELAIRCPSCPIPGVNLPEDWENAPPELQFLYAAIICMDANFRLKNQIVSNYSQDPGLGTGLAYMVPRIAYENYVLSRADSDDISTCVGFQALAKANTKFSRGLRYTGVGAAVCGRSEMILPSGVGNLQKGERYANMDYIFASALRSSLMPLVVISYDIACQWFSNIYDRMTSHWPDELKIPESTKLTPAIPKLHEPAHQSKNHEMYSLNYLPGVGMSDCECPERVWGPHNALGNSNKTQGPGSRQDVLDDHFNFWNWLKYIGLGVTLLRKYKAAVAERNLQAEAHRGLSKACEDKTLGWERMCKKWEEDTFPKKVKSPYKYKSTTMSEAEVRKKLEIEESERLRAGGISLHNTSPWVFVAMGLDLEDTQCILPIFMPGVPQYRADIRSRATSPSSAPTVSSTSAQQSDLPENEDIWLPSRIPTAVDRARMCVHGLADIEEQLRDAQLRDALDSLRMILRMKSRMVQFKNANIRGQRDGTRSRAMIDRVHDRARVCVEKYRAARTAKLVLAGPGAWEQTYRVLEDGDVRGYQDPNRLRPRQGRSGTLEDSQLDQEGAGGSVDSALEDRNFLFPQERERRDGSGETRRTLSWIWLTDGHYSNDGDTDEDLLRTEWARSRARANRAKEEAMLIKEEMRRVLAFLDWKGKWWVDRVAPRVGIGKDLAEGLCSYAEYQAGIHRGLHGHFLDLWKSPLAAPTESSNISSNSNSQNPDIDDNNDDESDGNDNNDNNDGHDNPEIEALDFEEFEDDMDEGV